MDSKGGVSKVKVLNSNDYFILQQMIDKKNNLGICEARGMTKKKIADKTGLSISTVNRSIIKLLDANLIGEAVKQVNTKAYYVNEKGNSRLSEIMKQRSGKNE